MRLGKARDSGQLVMQSVVLELALLIAFHSLGVEWRVFVRLLEHFEVVQHVVAVAVFVLVDLPAHSGLFQPFGVGGPGIAPPGPC